MKLYRIKDTATGKFYRHRYSQYRGGDWVDENEATIWTKPGGVNGAIGMLRERHKRNSFVIQTATIDHVQWSAVSPLRLK
jgi:hypothetical protein